MRHPFFVLALCLACAAATSERSWAVLGDGAVTLEWTSPGDDGMVGLAHAYDLRYFPMPITEQNFFAAFAVSGEPPPRPAGNRERFTVHGLIPNVNYYFALKTLDDEGNWSRLSNVIVHIATSIVAVAPTPLPLGFSSPWPNPASSSVQFQLTLPTRTSVRVEAFDAAGRRVRVLLQGSIDPGRVPLVWRLDGSNGGRVPAGLYLVRAQVGDKTFVRRVMVTP